MPTRRAFLHLLPALGLLDWTYGPRRGPHRWAELSPQYALCGSGQHQSPIALNLATAATATPEFSYQPMGLNLFNTGRTVQQRCPRGSWLTLDAQPYELLQFHFHTPSEHRWGEQGFPLEIHFVHRSPETKALAVVGVGVTVGEASPVLALLVAAWPGPGERSATAAQIQPAQLLPEPTGYLRYSGSLTTPPCSEGVTWLVATQPITAAQHQLDQLAHHLGRNARPLQQRKATAT